MACGCRKNKTQEVQQPTVQVSVNESVNQSNQNGVSLTPEQQQQVDSILDKIKNIEENR